MFITFSLHSFTLKEKITKAESGDYAVFQQGGIYTILIIRSISSEYLLLEEIEVPTMDHDTKKISWKNWVEQNGPGHTAWTSYLLELKTNKIIECYSHTKNSGLCLNNNFFTQLLTLPLKKTPEHERKKIGAHPNETEIDHRAFWYPPVTLENKTIENISITPWSSIWPEDPHSPISGAAIELYFSTFSMPHWIEIKTSHYKLSLQGIDGGHKIHSPKRKLLVEHP